MRDTHLSRPATPTSWRHARAWTRRHRVAFSREDIVRSLDYLFMEEAGQFSLANAVGMGQRRRTSS